MRSGISPPKGFLTDNHPLKLLKPAYLSRKYGQQIDDLEFCAIDFETTGLNPKQARLTEVAMVRFRADGTVIDEYATRINPGEFQGGVGTEFHGLELERDLKGAPTFEEVWPTVRRFISGAVLVAHNIAFEDMFLAAELDRAGIQIDVPVPGICTMVAAWSHINGEYFSQKVVYRRLTGGWSIDKHTALGDIRHLMAIFLGLLEQVPGLRYVGPLPAKIMGEEPTLEVMFARANLEDGATEASLPRYSRRVAVPSQRIAEAKQILTELLDDTSEADAVWRALGVIGVSGSQTSEILGGVLADIVMEHPGKWESKSLNRLTGSISQIRSYEIQDRVASALEVRAAAGDAIAPVIENQRWWVKADHPDRARLVEQFEALGVQVLATRRDRLDGVVQINGVPKVPAGNTGKGLALEASEAFVFLEESRTRALSEGSEWLAKRAAHFRGVPLPPPGVVIGSRSGGAYWDEEMRLDIRADELKPNWHWLAPKPDWDDPRDDEASEDEQDVDWGYGEDDDPDSSEQHAGLTWTQRMENRIKLLEEGKSILEGLRTKDGETSLGEATRQELLNRLKLAVTHVRDHRATEQIPERVVGIAGAVLTEREKRMVLEAIAPEAQREQKALIPPPPPQVGGALFARFKQVIKARSRHQSP